METVYLEKDTLSDADSDEEWKYMPPKDSRFKLPKSIWELLRWIAYVLALVVSVSVIMMSAAPGQGHGLDCGNSTSEARSKGCEFDQLLYAWTPPACSNRTLYHERSAQITADWYVHINMSEIGDLEVVAAGDVESIYANDFWRVQHCIYRWQTLGRAFLSGTDQVMSWPHEPWPTNCTGLFMDIYVEGQEWRPSGRWFNYDLQFLRCEKMSDKKWQSSLSADWLVPSWAVGRYGWT